MGHLVFLFFIGFGQAFIADKFASLFDESVIVLLVRLMTGITVRLITLDSLGQTVITYPLLPTITPVLLIFLC